ncbi:hypothetical protein JOM56_013817 [Amanita muscaria]
MSEVQDQDDATAGHRSERKRKPTARILENSDPQLKRPRPAVIKPRTSSAKAATSVPERSAVTQSSSRSGLGRVEENEDEADIIETRGPNPQIPSAELRSSPSQKEADTESEDDEDDNGDNNSDVVEIHQVDPDVEAEIELGWTPQGTPMPLPI